MSQIEKLIPPPPVVRERLAEHIREGRIIRALLKLSIREAEERHERERRAVAPQGQGVPR